MASDTKNQGLGVTRWAGLWGWEVKSQLDRQMEESGQHLKDEKGMKDGPGWVLWQSGIWMTLHTNVTTKWSNTLTRDTLLFPNSVLFYRAVWHRFQQCKNRNWRKTEYIDGVKLQHQIMPSSKGQNIDCGYIIYSCLLLNVLYFNKKEDRHQKDLHLSSVANLAIKMHYCNKYCSSWRQKIGRKSQNITYLVWGNWASKAWRAWR